MPVGVSPLSSPVARARIDTSIQRQTAPMPGGGQFEFPLGVYPVEPLKPIEGYTLAFESADDEPPAGSGPGWSGGRGKGGRGEDEDGIEPEPWRETEDDGPDFGGEEGGEGSGSGGDDDLEPWPDRYVFDINIRASRVESLCRQLFALLPGRVYPILDVMGNDGYREIDPYIAYDLVGLERFLDAVRRFRGWFFEDGMVGFGAMSEEPFVYVFIDEHKIVTVRVAATAKELVEKILKAFDLTEVDKIAGADAAVHEHRGVLDAPSNRPDLLTHDEIVEQIRDDWGLTLNVDPFHNNDENGNPLGVIPWRCVVRVFDERGEVRYAEIFLTTDSLQSASELAVSGAETLLGGEDPAAEPLPLTDGDIPWDLPSEIASDNPSTPPLPQMGKSGGKTVDKPTSKDGNEGGEKPESETGAFDDIPLDDLTMDMEEFDILVADRIRPDDVDQFPQLAGKVKLNSKSRKILAGRWLE